MKCPKCGYLGFETSERCRNCGYDFSLSVRGEAPSELSLRPDEPHADQLTDLDLGAGSRSRVPTDTLGLDLDRVIGADSDAAAQDERSRPNPTPTPTPKPPTRPARATPPPGLPLFMRDDDESGADDAPLVAPPRPARPPLSVRRTTPEVPRGRGRVTPSRGADEGGLWLEPTTEPPAAVSTPPLRRQGLEPSPAGPGARLFAAAIDLVLLAAIGSVVFYLTLAMAGLVFADVLELPLVPLATFMALLGGGYLTLFVAAGGQTIGKMAAGIRVIGDDGERVDIAGAALRALGCGVSLVTGGLAYLPAFVTADRRALHDRIAGTRVVSAR